MILKVFLGTVGPELVEELGENKVDKVDKDKDVSDTSVVDVVAAHPVPEYPSADTRNIPSIANSRRLKHTTLNLRCIVSSFVQAHCVWARIFIITKQFTCQSSTWEKCSKNGSCPKSLTNMSIGRKTSMSIFLTKMTSSLWFVDSQRGGFNRSNSISEGVKAKNRSLESIIEAHLMSTSSCDGEWADKGPPNRLHLVCRTGSAAG